MLKKVIREMSRNVKLYNIKRLLNRSLFFLFTGECPGIPVRSRGGRVPDDGKP